MEHLKEMAKRIESLLRIEAASENDGSAKTRSSLRTLLTLLVIFFERSKWFHSIVLSVWFSYA
jgi:hypothetical protein